MMAFRAPYGYLLQEATNSQGALRTAYTSILEAIGEEAPIGRWTLGPQVQQFEEAFAVAVGYKYAIGVSSGTDALFLAMKAVNLGAGSRVLTVPNTFYATVGAILQAGATPVFCDVGDDMLMDIELAKAALAAAPPHAVLPVDWAGLPWPHSVSQVVQIQDRAQSMGASILMQGSWPPGVSKPLMACYSLHPLKNLHVWGDGGMIVTDSQDLDTRLRLLRNHGLIDRDTWECPGYNMRLSTIQAIIGLHMLPLLSDLVPRRRLCARRFNAAFRGIPGVHIPAIGRLHQSAWHLYVLRVPRRDALLAHLNAVGIEAKIHYPVPLHLQPALRFMGFGEGSYPVAEQQAREIISLPVHEYLTDEQVEYIIEQVHGFYR